MVWRVIRGQWVFFLALAWVIGWASSHLWPASWWLDVRRVIAFDTPEDAIVVMDVDRTIRRRFVASWDAIVWRRVDDGWSIHCAAHGGGPYRPDAALPDPVTLGWWTNGQCETPPPGHYIISTVWTIQGGMLPDKIVRSESNVFSVTE